MPDKKPRGRPRFEPTSEQRAIVQALSRFGVTQVNIAEMVKVAPGTLRKAFAKELSVGMAEAQSAVTRTLFEMATSGRHPAATFFWLKCQAGWRETPRDSRWPDDQRERSAPLGKKEQAQLDAESAGVGTDWGDDLSTDYGHGLPN